jgi:hypothetical protein
MAVAIWERRRGRRVRGAAPCAGVGRVRHREGARRGFREAAGLARTRRDVACARLSAGFGMWSAVDLPGRSSWMLGSDTFSTIAAGKGAGTWTANEAGRPGLYRPRRAYERNRACPNERGEHQGDGGGQ